MHKADVEVSTSSEHFQAKAIFSFVFELSAETKWNQLVMNLRRSLIKILFINKLLAANQVEPFNGLRLRPGLYGAL